MPDAPGESAEDKQEKTEADAAFSWFGAALVLPQAAPVLPRLPAAANAIQLPDGQLPTGRAAPLPGTALVTEAKPAPIVPEAPVQDAVAIELKALATPIAGVETKAPLPTGTAEAPAAADRGAAPIRIELPPAQDTALRSQPITLAAIQPRAESAAPLAATAIEAPTPRRPAARETTISALTTLAADAPRAHAVPATAEAQQPALDMRRHEWMNSMVERIEALRDSSGSRETSIRLSPDALGRVDISIRQEGDRVHVRFTAETPAARAALAEAQPRLAELAEARGLRLGQTSVDGGAAGQGQRQDTAPRPAFASAPASAPGGEPLTDTDERIA